MHFGQRCFFYFSCLKGEAFSVDFRFYCWKIYKFYPWETCAIFAEFAKMTSPSEHVRLLHRIRKKKSVFWKSLFFLTSLIEFHAISPFPPTVNKGWRPGPLQKGATSKDLSVMRINKGTPMFQVCHRGLPLLTRGGRYFPVNTYMTTLRVIRRLLGGVGRGQNVIRRLDDKIRLEDEIRRLD